MKKRRLLCRLELGDMRPLWKLIDHRYPRRHDHQYRKCHLFSLQSG